MAEFGTRRPAGAESPFPERTEHKRWLVQVRGPRPAVHRELAEEQVLTFGRAPDCDVVLSERDASRYHARLRVYGGHAVLEDLGSTNGTRVNGEPVLGPRALRDGDTLEMGEAVFRYMTGATLAQAVRETL